MVTSFLSQKRQELQSKFLSHLLGESVPLTYLRILQLPYATRTRFLPQIMEISSATDQIYGWFLKMCKVMEHAKNC